MMLESKYKKGQTKEDWSFGSNNQKRIMEHQIENYQLKKEKSVRNNRKYFFDSNIYRGIFANEK